MNILTAVTTGAVDLQNISILNAGIVAVMGYAVVFFGLILLMCVITILGKSFQAAGAKAKAAAPAAAAPAAPVVTGAGEAVNAPMPGNILKVNVREGEAVKAGTVLVVLEAMKMENEIMAPKDGTVTQVLVSKGSTVDTGAPLVVIG